MAVKRTPDSYVFLDRLGQGSYSTVYRAVERANSGRNYAIKVCSKKHIIREKKVKYVTIEKDLLNMLAKGGHLGIVKLFCTFHDIENLYFVLEYVSGGELLALIQRLGRLTEDLSRHITAQLVDTVDYMHSKGVIHRDLKPENVLLSQEGRVVITDFGAACTAADRKFENTKRTASFVGTAEYVSPELLLHSQCGFSSDIWALGCIIYQLNQGKPPFRGENELQTFEKIVALDYKWLFSTSPQVVSIVQSILVTDPLKRPSAAQLKQNPWFASIDWDNRSSLWKGIWELAGKNTVPRGAQQSHTNGVPAGGLRITRRKPVQATGTTAIAEWRKKLGLGVETLPSPPPSGGNKAVNINAPLTKVRPSTPTSLTPPPSAPPPLIKRDISSILEIPYDPSKRTISLNGYSSIQDESITEFVSRNKKAILNSSTNCIVALDLKGNLTCQGPNQPPKLMISVADPDLSMYDFEFDETTKNGFLILEKYKSRLWFLSAASPKQSLPMNFRPLSREKTWVDCFFTARNVVTENNGKKATPPATAPPAVSAAPISPAIPTVPTVPTVPATSAAKPRPRPRLNAPANMMVSSSRFEVLHALSGPGSKSGDASSGASAAFKSSKKR